MIMLAKGNRSQQVTDACKNHGGFYLGSIGGPGGYPGSEQYQEHRVRGISGIGYGSDLEDRGRELPRVYLGR